MKEFLFALQQYPESSTVENPYKNELLLSNLEIYLKKMYQLAPQTILVGEAPGYKGCAKTGIPFTSEYIMLTTDNGVFGRHSGYKVFDSDVPLQKENTATIIWNEIRQYPSLPLLWNIFPFHPHKENNSKTNRAPSNAEIEIGVSFVNMLLDIFPNIKTIIAVGNRAFSGLARNNTACIKARHLSFGGKPDFCNCMSQNLK